ncbi:hypothetical protein EMIT0P44_170077 [Pseudomonas sp. IT-P44]
MEAFSPALFFPSYAQPKLKIFLVGTFKWLISKVPP